MLKDVTLPVLKPVLLILISLSIIWDFGVFTQPYLLIGPGQQTSSNYLMSVYLYVEGYGQTNFGLGAAISILMLLIVAGTQLLLRAQHAAGRVTNEPQTPGASSAWNVVGIVLFVVMAFPVYWMVSTAFKSNQQINSFTPSWFPTQVTLRHFTHRDRTGRTSGPMSRTV